MRFEYLITGLLLFVLVLALTAVAMRQAGHTRWTRSAGWLLALGTLLASLLSACGGGHSPIQTPQDNTDDTEHPTCYAPLPVTSTSRHVSPEDGSQLASQFHGRGIIPDSAYEKIARDGRSISA